MHRANDRIGRARSNARPGADRDQDASGDGGFVLLESMIAISLITVMMSALAVLFVGSLANTAHERTRAGAARVATTALDDLNGRDATSLVSGRTASCTYPTATSAVTPYLASMTDARDTDPNSTACAPTVSVTGSTQVIGSTTYTVNDYLGWCSYGLAADGTGTCVKSGNCTSSGGTSCYLRAVIAVSWAGSNCTPTSCTYVTSTLVSAKIDPTFKVNQPLPAVPIITDPGNQISAVGDTVSLQMMIQQNTGVPTFTWAATGLPAGLSINPAGLISNGSQTLVQNSAPATVTVTVTDAFLRQATRTFTWRVFPQLVASTPGPQSSLTSDSVNLALHATGGQGAPYTWSLDSGALPPGLSINSATSGDGSITGTPTTPGQYSFTLDVTDASTTRTGTTTLITWTVKYPPIVGSNPGAQTDTVGTARTLQLSASGGSGQSANYVWSSPDNSLAGTGLTINSAGRISGTLSSTVKDVTVNLQVSDPTVGAGFTDTVTFVWHVVGKPTVAAPGTQTMTETGNESVALAYACPNGSCTIKVTNAPPGLGLDTDSSASSANNTTQLTVGSGSGTVWITGVVSNSAVTTGDSNVYNPTVTITDSDSVAVTPAAGTWTVNVVPTLAFTPTATSPVTVQFATSRALSGASATASLGTAGYSYAFSGTKPSWLSINAATGALTGTTPGSRQAFTFTVLATDSDGVSVSGTVTWYVDDLALAIPNFSASKNASATAVKLDDYRTNGSSPYTYSASDLPNGVSIRTNGNLSGSYTKKGTFTATIYVTDSTGMTVADTSTFTVN